MPSVEGRGRYGELFRLWMKRSLAPSWSLSLLGLLALLSLADWTPSALQAGGLTTPRLARGLERQALWTIALLLVIGWTAWHGARVMGRWRDGEWSWISSRPVAAFRVWLATWAGASAGLGLLLVAVGMVVEVGAGLGAETVRLVATQEVDDARLEPGQTMEVHWQGDTPTTGTVRVFLRSSPGMDPTTDVRVEARRGKKVAHTEVRLDGRRGVEVEVPTQSNRPLIVVITDTGGGALALDGSTPMEWWRPAGYEWFGSCSVIWRAFLGLSALLGLAMGLGGRMSAASAAGLSACLLLMATTGDVGYRRPWIPLADLPAVLTIVGEGRLPMSGHLLLPLVAIAVGASAWCLAGRVR